MANNIEEILVTPISGMVAEMGKSVAKAAVSLTQAQAEIIREYPKELVEAGMTPTFFHMQDVSVELKLTLQIETEKSDRRKWRLFGTPMNAKYKNALKYEGSGSSSLKMTFAPGPPPLALDQSSEE